MSTNQENFLLPHNFKTKNIKGKEYVEVVERVKYLASNNYQYSLLSDYQYFPDKKMWVVKATLKIMDNGYERVYNGHAQEIESDNWKEVNHTSALENAETSAWGRAFAAAGIGVTESIASADEINKATRRVERSQPTQRPVKQEKKETAPPPQAIVTETPSDPSMATIKQKTELLLLLNNKLITNEEKNTMIEKMNRFTADRCQKAIIKIKQTIQEREADNYDEALMRLDELKTEAFNMNMSEVVDAIDQEFEQSQSFEVVTSLIDRAEKAIKARKEKQTA